MLNYEINILSYTFEHKFDFYLIINKNHIDLIFIDLMGNLLWFKKFDQSFEGPDQLESDGIWRQREHRCNFGHFFSFSFFLLEK